MKPIEMPPRDGGEMTEAEIALKLGITRGRVSQLLKAGMRKLRKILRRVP